MQKISTPNVNSKSMPEGINFLVLINRIVKLTDKSTFKPVKNNHAILGERVNNPTLKMTNIPLVKPIISETLLPFLNPKIPPTINKRP